MLTNLLTSNLLLILKDLTGTKNSAIPDVDNDMKQ